MDDSLFFYTTATSKPKKLTREFGKWAATDGRRGNIVCEVLQLARSEEYIVASNFLCITS